MDTDYIKGADYLIAVADREEVYDVCLKWFRQNKPIIHLFAGEISCWATHDDVYRHSLTLMSDYQFCINSVAKDRVEKLCKAVNKQPHAFIVGNLYLDKLDIDCSEIPNEPYDLVLYNPPTRYSKEKVIEECEEIYRVLKKGKRKYIWVSPNGDNFSDVIDKYTNEGNLPRPKYLGLLKKANKFITNSSTQYFEAPYIMQKPNIISIGVRNRTRESRYTDTSKIGTTENFVKILKVIE